MYGTTEFECIDTPEPEFKVRVKNINVEYVKPNKTIERDRIILPVITGGLLLIFVLLQMFYDNYIMKLLMPLVSIILAVSLAIKVKIQTKRYPLRAKFNNMLCAYLVVISIGDAFRFIQYYYGIFFHLFFGMYLLSSLIHLLPYPLKYQFRGGKVFAVTISSLLLIFLATVVIILCYYDFEWWMRMELIILLVVVAFSLFRLILLTDLGGDDDFANVHVTFLLGMLVMFSICCMSFISYPTLSNNRFILSGHIVLMSGAILYLCI